jgi:hypothetical protein
MANQTSPPRHTPAADPRTASQDEKVVTPTESRQAVKTGHMRYVLGFGLVLVIIAFALVYMSNA